MERSKKLLKRLGLIVLVFGAIWAAVIMRWRMTNRVPNGADVALYLFALPLGLLLLIWLGFAVSKGVRKHKQKKQAAAADHEQQPDGAAADDPSLAWQLPVIAVDALLAAGDSPDALVDAAREGVRADLHDALLDARAQPAFAAEVGGVDVDAVQNTLPESGRTWGDARKRALALGEMMATRMLDAHFDHLRSPPDSDAPQTRVRPPVLHLEWLLPADWSDADRDLAGNWLSDRLAEQDWKAPELRLHTRAVVPGAAVLQRLDEINRAFHQDDVTLPHLLLASDSHLDQATLTAWDATHCLHRADQPEGRIPGEGAAAILIAPRDHHAVPVPVQLGRLFVARRAKAVNQPQRLQADTLRELAEKAGSQSSWDGESELTLIADTDSRPSRGAEALSFSEALLPEQDAAQTVSGIGIANGHAGAASMLVAVAVAVHIGSTLEQPCLVFSHQDPVSRAVMFVAPPLPAADAAASNNMNGSTTS